MIDDGLFDKVPAPNYSLALHDTGLLPLRMRSVLRDLALLPIAKRPAEPRTGAVVAAGEMGGRLVVPVAVERDIPREVAENLYVIGRVHIEVHAPGYRYRRENTSGDVQVGLVETEKFRVRGDHGSGNVLRALCDRGLVVVRVLPSEATQHRDTGVVGVR